VPARMSRTSIARELPTSGGRRWRPSPGTTPRPVRPARGHGIPPSPPALGAAPTNDVDGLRRMHAGPVGFRDYPATTLRAEGKRKVESFAPLRQGTWIEMTRSIRAIDEPPSEETMDLREFLTSVRRRKWLVLALTLLVTGLAALYSFTSAPSYTATALVELRPTLTNPLDPYAADEISIPTEISVATSAAVSDVARKRMGPSLPEGESPLQSVSITAPEEARILQITYTSSDSRTAQSGAQAFADAYLLVKREHALETIAAHTSTLQGEIDALDEEVRQLSLDMEGLTRESSLWQQLLEQRREVEATRAVLRNELATLGTFTVDAGRVIQPPTLPNASTPRHRANIAIGAVLGLVAGIVLAAASERLRDRVRSRDDLEDVLQAPVLGITPKRSSRRRRLAPLPTVDEPRSMAAEAIRTLRTNFLAVRGRPSVKTVLVTSAGRKEGKTTIAANLAAALAQVGKEVVLVSGDLRHPDVHSFFGVANDRGLSQVLTGELTVAEAISESPIRHLRILPSGPVTGILDPVELLQSNRMLDVIVQCSGADFVLIDSAPILGLADSLVLAEMVDGILLAADPRKSNRAALAQARDQLRQVRGRVLGSVFMGYEPHAAPSGRSSPDAFRGVPHRLLVLEPETNGRYPDGDEPWHPRRGRADTPYPSQSS
jgi:capsular exopolysaccharide synthesis family protein